MSFRSAIFIAAFVFPLMIIQLLGGRAGSLWGLSCALGVGVLGVFLCDFFDANLGEPWLATLPALLGSLIGVLILYGVMPRFPGWGLWLAPAVAGLASGGVVLWRRIDSRRCGLCNQRLGHGLSFECPRCGLRVCDQRCWDFDHCRCALCVQNKVTVFSPDRRWWEEQFGSRLSEGRCQLCLSTAAEADLRGCGRCGRPQCRECWDFANGQCSRCHWIVQDLPAPLHPFLYGDDDRQGETSGTLTRHAVRHR